MQQTDLNRRLILTIHLIAAEQFLVVALSLSKWEFLRWHRLKQAFVTVSKQRALKPQEKNSKSFSNISHQKPLIISDEVRLEQAGAYSGMVF